jgi:hypothetical protein
MKGIFMNINDTLADAALLEMGVDLESLTKRAPEHDIETLEEMFVEVAFAEAADYDDIRAAILREHRSERDIARPDDCQYGENDLCFV